MENHNRTNAPPPERIAKKHAPHIGGSSTGLSAAAFLVIDSGTPNVGTARFVRRS